MNEYALKHTDQEDILDVIELAERSFRADLSAVYNKRVSTLGEFVDLMNQYTPGESATDCTTQQAFYRIRSSLTTALLTDPASIRPDTSLAALIPPANRRKQVEQLDQVLGFRTELLVPKQWQVATLAILLLISLVSLFPAWPYSLAGLALYGVGVWLMNRTANTFAVSTVRQLAQKISREHYRAIRRDAATVNRNELEPLVLDLFSHELGISRPTLSRDTLLLRD